ncbi:S49 family peptidase [Chromobacterium violaceum]|uniref:S49 family peptidase n=1 Tax=Chromobacterium violaceum TaxID=536 RepID=UPI001E5CADF3|nr:S49 family peptidase [Chromobacterium violaceum]MCD0492332.1 S49 family peptidase [Chromobacterium violaceum]
MKQHLYLHQLFNQPHMVLPDMLHEAVAWAGTRMGLNLQQVNVNLPDMAWKGDGPREVEAASPADRRQQAAQQTGVLVIPVSGILVPRANDVGLCANQTSYESVRAQLNAGLADPQIEHIVYDMATPGGAATGCFELAADTRAARAVKPITALVHYSAYSAGYALACACSDIVLSQTSGVGSIGVIMKHVDISKQLEADGITVTTLYRGARKNDMASDTQLSDDARANADKLLDLYYEQFCETVAEYRGLRVQAIRDTEAGLFYGPQAVSAGLADRVESQQQAVNRIVTEVAARRKPTAPTARRASALATSMQMSINT